MPPIRRRPLRTRRHYTLAHLEALAYGRPLFPPRPPMSEDDLRQAWDDLGPALLDLHIATFPTTRPHAWWRFAAPAARRLHERQDAFLRRHGLLTDAEHRAVAAPAWSPPEDWWRLGPPHLRFDQLRAWWHSVGGEE